MVTENFESRGVDMDMDTEFFVSRGHGRRHGHGRTLVSPELCDGLTLNVIVVSYNFGDSLSQPFR